MTAARAVPEAPRRPLHRIGLVAAALAGMACVVGLLGQPLPLSTPYRRNLATAMLQLALATLATGAAACWAGAHARTRPVILGPRTAWIITAGAMMAYAVGLSALSLMRHRALLTGVWDLGYYAQLTGQLAQLEVPRSSVWQGATWGNHATFLLAVLAPLLWIVNDPAMLLVAQSTILCLGAVPAFVIGRQVWAGSHLAGIVAALGYLLYPPLQFSNLADFHADSLATPLLLAAFAAAITHRPHAALAWASALMLVKEDIVLVAGAFSLYVAFAHRCRAGFVLAALAAGGFVYLVQILIPGWTGMPYLQIFNRWPHLGDGPAQLVLAPIMNPGAFFGTLVQPERLGYVVLLATPLAGLPFLAPEILAVGLPPLISNLLSSAEGQYTIRSHYTATLTPVLMAAALVGSRRLGDCLGRASIRPQAALAALAATSLAASAAFSPLPWSLDPFPRKLFSSPQRRDGIAAIAGHLPADASLSAANHLGAHFALRRTLHLFPTNAGEDDFVLVDVHGRDYVWARPVPARFDALLGGLIATRPLLVVHDGLALFGRGAPSPDAVARLVRLGVPSAIASRSAGEMELVSVELTPGRVAPRENAWLRYTWRSLAPRPGTPCIREALVPSSGPPAWERTRPMFHGILNGSRWPAGQTAEEMVSLLVPEETRPGRYTAQATAWYDSSEAPCRQPAPRPLHTTLGPVEILPW